jgi:hypothetical protein
VLGLCAGTPRLYPPIVRTTLAPADGTVPSPLVCLRSADPDMLELGAPVVGPHAARYQPSRGRQTHSLCNASDGTVGDTGPRLSLEQGKAQFAGWCTVSSPLVLGGSLGYISRTELVLLTHGRVDGRAGFDMANQTEYDRWFPLLSNPRALSIQAAWAGSAGKLVASGGNFTTIVPHGCSCEAMSDVKGLPEWTVWRRARPLPGCGAATAPGDPRSIAGNHW